MSVSLMGRERQSLISPSLNAGEILGFLGTNGAGKNTTLKMLLGFFPPQTLARSMSLDRTPQKPTRASASASCRRPPITTPT